MAKSDVAPSPVSTHLKDEAPVIQRGVEKWAALKGTSVWLFAGAIAANKWQVGPYVDETRLTEAAFDAAVSAVANSAIG